MTNTNVSRYINPNPLISVNRRKRKVTTNAVDCGGGIKFAYKKKKSLIERKN